VEGGQEAMKALREAMLAEWEQLHGEWATLKAAGEDWRSKRGSCCTARTSRC
jgi:hypothetical protein